MASNQTNNQRAPKDFRQTLGKNLSFGAAEAYKLLRTNLNFSLPDGNGCKVIGVTSSLRGEGKSTTSINIAYTMAQTGNKVLLLEADLRLPTVANRLRVHHAPGLSNLLVGQCNGQQALQNAKLIDGLWVMTAGDIPPNPAELLGSEHMRLTIEAMSRIFDVIIIDLPPVSMVTDALVMSKNVQGMVVVVRQNYCDRSSLNDTIRQLRFAEAKILGLVMTDADTQKKKRYGYYKHQDEPGAGRP